MSTKNTVKCPACSKVLRVSARVVSDGNEYWFFLCPKCEDVVLQDTAGNWCVRGEATANVPEVVSALQAMAIESWRQRSTTREPITNKLT